MALAGSATPMAHAGAINGVMLALEQSMETIEIGIAKQDYSMILVGAKGIEERPAPSWIDKIKIFADLGSNAPAFKAADKEMKRLAKVLAQSAGRYDLDASRRATFQLRQQCVTCHEKQIPNYATSRNPNGKSASKQKPLKGENK